MEMENIYIHDNDFNAVGLWTALVMWGDPTMVGTTPMKNWVFENNQIGDPNPIWQTSRSAALSATIPSDFDANARKREL